MTKHCARCHEIVYPVEELKCLDKVWHKRCFRCTECNMALTLKDYIGHNRMPYCSAHAPKMRATPIASTPEMKRLTNNTKIQSNIRYHEQYERGKGRSAQLANGVETVRYNFNTKLSSNVAYRVGKLEHKNIVAERKRQLTDVLHMKSPYSCVVSDAASPSSSGGHRSSIVNLYEAKTRVHQPLSNHGSCHSSSSSSLALPKFKKLARKMVKQKSNTGSNNSRRPTTSSSSNASSTVSTISTDLHSENSVEVPRLVAGKAPGSMEELYRHNFIYDDSSSKTSVSTTQSYEPTITNLEKIELNTKTASNATLTAVKSGELCTPQNGEVKEKQEESKDVNEAAVEVEPTTYANVYRAAYDFNAQDTDEVSFREGDTIIEVEPENSGWMTGRVERTGKIGMLPLNYVEKVKGRDNTKKQDVTQLANYSNAIQTKDAPEN